jgi:bifunctional UDP-N-acetylglucosamine pyrophosphorylase / glucosamine-1-phosphate N-acetyltransferase
MKSTAVLLAAGQGTRMKSGAPKVLHHLAGQPMILYPLESARRATSEIPVVVVGYRAEDVRRAIDKNVLFAVQSDQLGTGHAVQQTETLLRDRTDLVLVVNGDLPLLSDQTLNGLVRALETSTAVISMLTRIDPKARGFGRIVRDGTGKVVGIIEEAQATPEQSQIQELNVGAYCFKADWLWPALGRIPVSSKGEYYLTDLVEIAIGEGSDILAIPVEDPTEAIGVNDRVHLAEAEAALRGRINRRWMEAGVTMIDPDATYIDAGVTIGEDSEIWPNTFLLGNTRAGVGCRIGPNTQISNSLIGNQCTIVASFLEEAQLGDNVEIGPFARLRKGARLANGVHMGNFGEIKNASLGPGTKMGHFSYIGDATIGANVNIGAGTVTCNYDGSQKHHTEIGDGVFIGSDTMLVAPVKLERGASTGAGAVVTKDVPEHTLVAGVPAREIRKLKESD